MEARLKFKKMQSPLPFLSFPFFLFPLFFSPPFLPLFPSLYQLGGLDERCELLPQLDIWDEAPVADRFGAYLSQKEWFW